MVLAPIVRGRKGEYGKLLEQMRLEGYSRVRIDGELLRLDEDITLDKKYKHDISVVVDRLVMKPELRRRLSESVEAAAGLAAGLVGVELLDDKGETEDEMLFSEQFACLNCGTSIPELEPRIFSFNSPHGACDRCTGLGFQRVIDPELVVPDPTLSLSEGALQPWRRGHSNYWKRVVEAVAKTYKVGTRHTVGGARRTGPRDLPLRHRRRAPRNRLLATASAAAAPTACASRASSTTSSGASRRPTQRRCVSGSRGTWPSSPARPATAPGCAPRASPC